MPQYIFSIRGNCYFAVDSELGQDHCLGSVEECLDKADLIVDSTNMDTDESCDAENQGDTPACQFAVCVHTLKIFKGRWM